MADQAVMERGVPRFGDNSVLTSEASVSCAELYPPSQI